MAKNYLSGMKSASKKIEKAANKYASFAGEVASLPYQLTEEYRKAQDPILNQKINKSQQDALSAPVIALDKYKDISDPTARRALAEGYAGTMQTDYKNLTDERTRREGVYNDYIAKWTGLYGAEAAKRQAQLSAMESSWSRSMNLASAQQSQANYEADAAESRRRWEYEQAHKGGSGGSGEQKSFLADAVATLQGSVGTDGKVDPKVYEQVRTLAVTKGINKSTFDSNFSSMLSNDPNNQNAAKDRASLGIDSGIKEKSATEKLNELKLKNAQSLEDIKSKADSKQDNYYWSGTKIKKKKTLFGFDWLAGDETIQ